MLNKIQRIEEIKEDIANNNNIDSMQANKLRLELTGLINEVNTSMNEVLNDLSLIEATDIEDNIILNDIRVIDA